MTMTDDIEWSTPPGFPESLLLTGPRPLWPTRLAGFEDRPGEWGRLRESYPKHVMSDLRRAQRTGIISREFRFRSSGEHAESGRCHVWACYGRPVEGPDPGPFLR